MSHRRRAVLAGATVALSVAAMPGAASAADANPRLLGIIPTPLDNVVSSLPVVSTLPLVGGTTTGVTDVASLTSLLDVLTAPLASGGLPGAGALPIPGLSALPIVGGGSAGGSDPVAALTALVPGLNALTAGLPVGGLPTGMVPTGESLAPATALLRQLAAAAAGTPLASALNSLADQIDAAGAAGVSPDLLGVLAATLDAAANTPGVPAPVADAAKQLSTALKPASPTASTTKPPAATTPTKPVTLVPAPAATAGAPAAKAIGKARITSVRVDRKRGRVRVAMKCPTGGPTCKSLVSAARGSALGTSTILMTVGAGKTSARNLKMTSASRKAIKKRTTKFRVAAIRPGGSLSQRTATTKVPKKKKASKK